MNKKDIWISSDFHAYHKNICIGCTAWKSGAVRDFNDPVHMTIQLMENINNVVKQNDILYFLGDWSFNGFDRISQFRNLLNVKEIHFILGNHDHHIERNRGNVHELFTSVQDKLDIVIDGISYHMSHYPKINVSSTSHRSDDIPTEDLTKSINLFGHIHSQVRVPKRGMDVGVDSHPEFRPYHIDEIRQILEI